MGARPSVWQLLMLHRKRRTRVRRRPKLVFRRAKMVITKPLVVLVLLIIALLAPLARLGNIRREVLARVVLQTHKPVLRVKMEAPATRVRLAHTAMGRNATARPQ